MKWHTTALALLIGSIGFAATADVPADFAASQARNEKRTAALDALRKGDKANADALLLQAIIGTVNSAAWHRDYAELLTSAAIDLKDHDKYKLSTDYFHRAASELQAALDAKDAPTDGATKALIYHQLGFAARVADGDQVKANDYFKKAVEADPTNTAARAALQRTATGRKDLDVLDKKAPPTQGKPNG